jgi:molybdopterin biosynthesis enzyme MoaB
MADMDSYNPLAIKILPGFCREFPRKSLKKTVAKAVSAQKSLFLIRVDPCKSVDAFASD